MLFIRQLKLNARCHLKIFLTSRPESDLSKMLENNPWYQIDANDTPKYIPFVAVELNEYQNRAQVQQGRTQLPQVTTNKQK